MKAFLSFFQAKLLAPILVAIFSIVGTCLVQQWILTKAQPVLKKDVIQIDLSGLSPEIKKQITLAPINYSLQNNSHALARNVTITIRSDNLISAADLKFSQDSEDHQFTYADPHEFKVNIPSIRPGGFVGFQILAPPNIHITFSELSDNALFETQTGVLKNAEQEKNLLEIWVIVSAIVLIWLPVLSFLIYVFIKVGKTWKESETATEQKDFRKQLIILIVGLYIYDDLVIGSLGMLGPWLPLPRIRFDELISAFVLYLIVTRYRLVENWLIAKTENLKKGTATNGSRIEEKETILK
jgi:hypothetical protein